MDAQTLSAAMGGNVEQARYEQLVGPFNKAMRDADITNVNRADRFPAIPVKKQEPRYELKTKTSWNDGTADSAIESQVAAVSVA